VPGGATPESILTTTFSDELLLQNDGRSKVFGISWKDRAAVPMAGHTGKAFWFDNGAGGAQFGVQLGRDEVDLAQVGRQGLLLQARAVLHGAAGTAESVARVFPLADEFGVIILAPESREWTWDGLLGRWGPDLQMIHAAIEYAIAHSSIDPQRVGMAGFSDGASYALSLGIANGDVFTRLMAFSAGVLAPPEVRGRPRIFISHGTRDRVMPIDDTGRKIVARLKKSQKFW